MLTRSQKKLYMARLKGMLKLRSRELSGSCPINNSFIYGNNEVIEFSSNWTDACKFCTKVNVPFLKRILSFCKCPCHVLNDCEEAEKYAWLAVKKYERKNGELPDIVK